MKKMISITTRTIAFLVLCAVVATSCLTRDPCSIPPAQSVKRLGSESSRWVYIGLAPIYPLPMTQTVYMVCRYVGEYQWVIHQNGSNILYVKKNDRYQQDVHACKDLETKKTDKMEPCFGCECCGKHKQFLDVDFVKAKFPEINLIVVDDGNVGFIISPLGKTSMPPYEYITIRMGGGDVIHESTSMKSLLLWHDASGVSRGLPRTKQTSNPPPPAITPNGDGMR